MVLTRRALAHARPNFDTFADASGSDRRKGLHLTLKHNGRLVYEIPASMALMDRIGVFFGNEASTAWSRQRLEIEATAVVPD